MGSPVSPILANLFMEELERRIMSSYEDAPRIWFRYVDDTFVIMERNKVEEFTAYLNRFHPSIKFTAERESSEGTIGFLDCLVNRSRTGELSTKIQTQRDTFEPVSSI